VSGLDRYLVAPLHQLLLFTVQRLPPTFLG
jgi:hypothetical protein